MVFERLVLALSYFTYPFLWYQSQGRLLRSKSNVKVTIFEKMAVARVFVFHKHILFEVVKQPKRNCNETPDLSVRGGIIKQYAPDLNIKIKTYKYKKI